MWDLGPVRRLIALQQAQLAKMNRLEATLTIADTDGDGRTDIKELEGIFLRNKTFFSQEYLPKSFLMKMKVFNIFKTQTTS